MLKLTIPKTTLFNEETNKFSDVQETTLSMEHSLVSVSKWEQFMGKPFLGRDTRTDEETLHYIKCMVLSPEDVSEDVFRALTPDNMNAISEYINHKMTATWFSNQAPANSRTNGEVVTAEVMYYWLVALQIDFQVQHWHLNTMLTLVRVTNIKNDPKKKMMPKEDAAAERARLNAERKAQYKSKG